MEYDTDLLYLQDANGLGTSVMHDWPSVRVRETSIYASSLHSLTVCSEQLGGPPYGEGGLLTAPWMVPGGTNYSAVDSPGGPLLGRNTYSMTDPASW